jgi:hypothetical protein
MGIKKSVLVMMVAAVFLLSGCAPSSPPVAQLLVYVGSCHIIGNNVYFIYNGNSYVAKNQLGGYQAQLRNKNSDYELVVIENADGSFTIPNN